MPRWPGQAGTSEAAQRCNPGPLTQISGNHQEAECSDQWTGSFSKDTLTPHPEESGVTFSTLSFPDIICQPGRWNEAVGGARSDAKEGKGRFLLSPHTFSRKPSPAWASDVDPPCQAGAGAQPFTFALHPSSEAISDPKPHSHHGSAVFPRLLCTLLPPWSGVWSGGQTERRPVLERRFPSAQIPPRSHCGTQNNWSLLRHVRSDFSSYSSRHVYASG